MVPSSSIDGVCSSTCGGMSPAAGLACSVSPFKPAQEAEGSDASSDQWVLCDSAPSTEATVRIFDSVATEAIVHLDPLDGDSSLAPFFGRGIHRFGPANGAISDLLAPQIRRFLAKVAGQVAGAERGLSLEPRVVRRRRRPTRRAGPSSVEPCIASPRGSSPIESSIHTGSIGRPASFTLTTVHVRSSFVSGCSMNGTAATFRGFLQRHSEKCPRTRSSSSGQTCTPADVAAADLSEVWRAETDRWGGERAFQEHWNRCRSLPHEFLCCDLMEGPEPLLDRVQAERSAVIWWSNAFSTIYSNWFLTIDERRRRYLAWIEGLAARNPSLLLYGADHINSSVNSIGADEYRALARNGDDDLNPGQFHRLQIRS